ncbi:MAG: diphthine--ammonia ligase [Nanoarchaeota archaeon]|nr:diphthine--ammonia ligase [Nanoarchaeota archaeon]MBU1632149.1 diphthine--ammonia ligase [Nanoarchaeota archaeon]MBU1876350.1 diphthine--ammonia ligase [Nanoarchaeota archaeon]
MKLAALFTGGKDSTYAIYLAKQQGHEITCLITMKSENPDSYMFHTPAIELTELQAESMDIPIVIGGTEGIKEEELKDLEKTIQKAKDNFEFEGLITGALFSEYQSSRIEKIAEKLGLKVFSPLWHRSQEKLMEELLEKGFKFILTSVAGEGMSKDWLGKIITNSELDKLKDLNKETGFHIAFEGGEAESLVLDCPLFKKKIKIIESEKIMENDYTGRLIVKKAKLIKK